MKPILRVEKLSKQYQIRAQQTSSATLRETVAGAFRSPFEHFRRKRYATNEIVWSLRDVSFEIQPGEVVGIIGHNGAGKSTLLKILSRITQPTTGRVELYGRIGSLLEVGTGFHPELTGRENIYLNGAVLGMRRSEIDRNFDEIVAFAETEKYLDTPVKHYSSGMYMRLAFAVAAHLDPEILLVDEVLAVGDAAFQRKCLGKMNDVAKQGRTVLFVSHNTMAVQALCSRGLFLKNGQLEADSDIKTTVGDYLSEDNSFGAVAAWDRQNAPQSPEIMFVKAYMLNHVEEYAPSFDYRKEFSIVIEYRTLKPVSGLRVGFFMENIEGVPVCGSNDPSSIEVVTEPGHYVTQCTFPAHTLNVGSYSVLFAAESVDFKTGETPERIRLLTTPPCLSLTIEDAKGHGPLKEQLPGILRPQVKWMTKPAAG